MSKATVKQLGYFLYLMEEQNIIQKIEDYEKFEKIEGVNIFRLTKKQASDYIEKLKGDIDWLERISNQIRGTH